MKYSRIELFGVSSGKTWPWGSNGSVIAVGINGVESIESHPDGCFVVKAQRRDSKEPMTVAIYAQGCWAQIASMSEFECDICHQTFNGPQALANHRASHAGKKVA
jgi:hypothetical protein